MKKIGITTTVPIEVLIAANYQPIDLNNVFVTSSNYQEYIEIAEREGFPKSSCAWIKGIYGVCIKEDINEIIGVMEGDCSNTKSLLEVLSLKGIKIHSFSFPHSHSLEDVTNEIQKFMKRFHVEETSVEKIRIQLKGVREKAKKIDELTYKENKVSGFENHLYQISLSDCNGNVESFEQALDDFIKQAQSREKNCKSLRLAYIGVPPMTADLYDYVENYDAQFVYNEVQREFAFPRYDQANTIFEQYYDYTYPYENDYRLAELKKEISKRKIDAIIHYTQAFCHRAIEDIYLKNKLDIPILHIEGDKINTLDARTKLRIEAFLDMILDTKGVKNESIRN
ncbi:benzoyl-CoA reductase/2-hydroxyglutaryl-CoA dehydratase subunit BcrC/BadD/HgdB [Natranaerovirga hydrolytica]|uniref:Benzoyl-CoA reductase/2-hydroxyglutaryl-CoA dehydratase subunit BcrC/BadD/HgdB n=1 Tax=Natranaerovirga hydrolytica TaxID=680378 RepID=A0A4R1MJ71_9FIRM|nr:2-hydroxyacyl-CoA dehydratase [Natranaerovirga hydrolytica]TCK92818.1 benzoyl-CoA reductase/2-hydroxyglutaryl-CoA dehydratase subunit BcrC/BadD/HgdB [Natranaerovirga hydrolytica]